MGPTLMDARRDTHEPSDGTRELAQASDQDLVAEYGATRSPAAFRRMVERHAAMVVQTSYRLVGNWHDAEDVGQAAFLVLAQRAGAVKSTLGGWLHKVARDLSLQVLRARARRARREEDAVRRKTPAPATENDLREELDQVLVQLPDRMREAVVLRYLEGRGQEEAAQLAGCDKGTLSRRCTEGLNRLESLLARRGMVVAPAVMAGFLAQQASASLSAATVNSVQLAAVSGAASVQASALAKGALSAMFWAKAKVAAAVVAAAASVGTAGVVVLPRLVAPAPPATAKAEQPREVVLRLDFEDGKLPAICSKGKVVKGPDRPGNLFCLEGERSVFLEKAGGLFSYSDDLFLVFDLWVDSRVSTLDLHFWDQTQQGSFGIEPLRVAREQWVQGVVVRIADFRFGTNAPKPGDVITNLAIQAGQIDGKIYVDNLEVVRSTNPPALPKEPKK